MECLAMCCSISLHTPAQIWNRRKYSQPAHLTHESPYTVTYEASGQWSMEHWQNQGIHAIVIYCICIFISTWLMQISIPLSLYSHSQAKVTYDPHRSDKWNLLAYSYNGSNILLLPCYHPPTANTWESLYMMVCRPCYKWCQLRQYLHKLNRGQFHQKIPTNSPAAICFWPKSDGENTWKNNHQSKQLTN